MIIIKIFKNKNMNNNDELKAFVTEKPKPTFEEKQNNYKDG